MRSTFNWKICALACFVCLFFNLLFESPAPHPKGILVTCMRDSLLEILASTYGPAICSGSIWSWKNLLQEHICYMLLEQCAFQIWSWSIFDLEYSSRLLMVQDHIIPLEPELSMSIEISKDIGSSGSKGTIWSWTISRGPYLKKAERKGLGM